MLHVRRLGALGLLALLTLSIQWKARADDGRSVKTVFVIAMENHNWTQPANQFSGPIQQIFQNPNAPFINSLVNGTAVTTFNIFNDADPFVPQGGPTRNQPNNLDNQLHLVRLLAHAGKTWRSYQEDIDLMTVS